LIPVAPAIANAIFDAVGVRIKDLPIKAEKVFLALADLKNQP
jgi:xanthine dehydrogenase molybdenum-binding subunit